MTILLTPLLVVTLLADGHRDLALAYLVPCLVYTLWLSPLTRAHR